MSLPCHSLKLPSSLSSWAVSYDKNQNLDVTLCQAITENISAIPCKKGSFILILTRKSIMNFYNAFIFATAKINALSKKHYDLRGKIMMPDHDLCRQGYS